MLPQTISILPPENNSACTSNNLSVNFNASLNSTTTWYNIQLNHVCYKASWQEDNVVVYRRSHNDLWNPDDNDPYLIEHSRKLNLIEIPEGEYTLTIIVRTIGAYVKVLVYYEFRTNVSSYVSLPVDTTPPQAFQFYYL
jgi:hypothetical protein